MLRILLIAITVALYVFSWYQARQVPDNLTWENRKPKIALYRSDETGPFYSEGFIDEASEGRMSHASTLTALPYGAMLAAWYSGSREGASDVAIYYALYNAKTGWYEPRVLVDRASAMRELGMYVGKLGNPVLYFDGKGKIWAFFSSVAWGGWSCSSLNYKVSTDWGTSWSPTRKLYLSPFFNLTSNVKNPPLPLDDGSFVLPIYHEFITKHSLALRVRTEGPAVIGTELRRMTSSGSAIQPSLLYTLSGDIRALMRNMGPEKQKHILETWSSGPAMTWNSMRETDLPNPNSGFDTSVALGGHGLAVINDSYDDRSNLTLLFSKEGRRPWERLWVFDEEEGKEYSYPTLVRSTGGIYHLTYTYDRKRIKHVMFDDLWLNERIRDARNK